jgi:hypothetical protein
VPGSLSETFFRPDQRACERLTIPADLYNMCRLALSRCRYKQVYVPVRSMQFLAVIEPDEVIFVDSQAYAVQDGVGGKLICLAWSFRPETGRSDLTEPAPIELKYYREDARKLHGRLAQEFRQSLEALITRMQENDCESHESKVVPFRG